MDEEQKIEQPENGEEHALQARGETGLRRAETDTALCEKETDTALVSQEEGTEEPQKGKKHKKHRQPKTKEEKKALFKSLMFTAILPVILSGIIRAFGVYIFVTPNNFAPGGITGASVLIEYVTEYSSGIFLAAFSVPLFFIAFFYIGKKEAITSTVSMFLSSGLLILFKALNWDIMQYKPGDTEPLFHGLMGAVAGGVFQGIALAIMLRGCGASGGTSIIAALINKKFKNLSVSMLTSVFDAIVVFISIFVYDNGDGVAAALNPVLLALVSLLVTSFVCDVILQGFKSAYKFEIITDHPDEVAAEIMEKTHHGVTRVEAEGMYSHENKSMLVCIIRKRQIAELQRIIRSYPGTFAYFMPTSEVYGKFAK